MFKWQMTYIKIYKKCGPQSRKYAVISVDTVHSLFRRKNPPKVETLQCICNAFGLTLAQFFLDDEAIEMLSDSEKQMLTVFRKLTPKQQQALISVFTE